MKTNTFATYAAIIATSAALFAAPQVGFARTTTVHPLSQPTLADLAPQGNPTRVM
ncbi:MAG: hypothetical protein ACYCVB_14950 [Bacilli bacterium]